MSDPRIPGEDPDDLGIIDDLVEPEPEPEEPELDEDGNPIEPEPEPEPEPETQVERRPTRGQSQQAHLRARAQAAETKLADLERQIADLRARPATPLVDPYAQQREAEAERQRVEAMMPHEQIAYYREKDRREFGQAFAQQTAQIQDTLDKQAWDLSLQTNPRRAQYAADVERILAQEKAQGRSPSREIVFKYVLGDAMERRAQQNLGRQQRQAQRRLAGQTTRPARAGGDVSRGGSNGRDADEALLRRMTVGDI